MSAIPSNLDCSEAQRLVQRFASAQLETAERQAMRLHAAGCTECSEHFERVVATMARLGREKRETRVAEEKALRRHELRQDVLGSEPSPRWSRGRLRTLLYPLFFAILMWGLSKKLNAPGGAVVLAQGPEVWLRGQVLAPGALGARLRVRERLYVGSEGHAQIRFGPTTWDLEPGSEVRLEGLRPVSMRLFQGALAVEGPFKIYLPGGVLIATAPSSVQVALDSEGPRLTVRKGNLQWVHAEGTATFEPGTTCSL